MSNIRLQKLLQFHDQQPDDLFLIYALGMEYLGIGEVTTAEQYFKEVMSKDEGYVPVYYQLGKIYENKGEDVMAIATYEKGIEVAKTKSDTKAARELKAALDELTF
jgi:Tfp pilus assembly protein PilF